MKLRLKKWGTIMVMLCVSLFGGNLYAQSINVTGGLTANDMATILLGTNVTISNAQFTGGSASSGSFTSGSSNFPISNGVLLTTGTLDNAVGPNTTTGITGNNGQPGDPDLDALIPGFQTNDATILEFDITSNCTELSLEYIFASEEYLEYGCSSFNDVFGFFISGPGYTGLTNIALVPGTTTPVSIDNVIDNPPSCVSNPSFYVNNPPGSPDIQYDGRTVLLSAQAIIQPCQTYHIKIAIADAGDSILDSGIFLKGGGVNCVNSNLDVAAVVANLVCTQPGSIDITVNSGAGPFDYQWTGPNGFTDSTEDVSGLFPGDYTVQVIGSDCLSTGEFTYTIIDESDQEVPVIACPSDFTVSADSGLCSASGVNLGSPIVTDNCGIASVTNDGLMEYPLGSTTVTWTATDSSGNVASCIQIITVIDTEAPTIVCPADVTVSADSGVCTASNVSLGSETTSDNCSVASVTNDAPAVFPLGSTTVTWTVTDGSGNTASCSQVVTVEDTEAPTIVCPADVTVSADSGVCTASNVSLGSETTSDNCSVASITNDAPAVFPLGSTTITWIVTDGSGNAASCTQVVTVEDTEAPTIVCPADVTVSADSGVCTASNVSLGSETTSDNCSVASITNDAPGVFPLGSTTVTWTVTDGSGNTASCSQVVTVEDTEAPTIVCPADVTVSADSGVCTASNVSLGSETTSDNCSVASVTNDAPAVFPLGSTTVTWTVTDGSGNTASCSQVVTVEDTEAPTIVCPADVTVSADSGVCTASNVSLGVETTSDNCSVASITNDAPAVFPLGSTTVTWTVMDGSGNTASCTQVITVEDVEAPAIVCPADITVSADSGVCSASNVSLGSETTSDNCSVASFTNDAPAVFPLGSTTVTWIVTDGSGNTASCAQVVTVEDMEAPTITCPADITVSADSGVCTASNVSLGAETTSDNCSVASITNDAPAVFPLGSTTVTWTVTDGSGNTASCSQVVTVEDTEAPIAICQDYAIVLDELGLGSITVQDIDGGSTDNCGVLSITASQTAFGCEDLGANTVVLTVVDNSGNSSTCDATVTVTEGSFVDLTCSEDLTFDCNNSCGSTGSYVYWDEPTASSFTSCDNGCGSDTHIDGFIYMGELNGSRYYCSNTSNFTWTEANVAAMNAGGDLVAIGSAEENEFIGSQIMASYAWIGYSDENVEGTFEWSNGDPTTYTNWNYGEPNNDGPGGYYGSCGPCGPADYTVISSSSERWYDRRACNEHEFVMEIPCGNPITITQVSGPANGSVMDGGTSEMVTYVAVDSLTGASATCSFMVTVSECVPVYCTSSAACTAYEWIDDVALGTISNPSGNNGGYGDYTNLVQNAQPGDVIDLELTPGFSYGSYMETWRVWVDWNYDGDFYDQGELVYQGYGSGVVNGAFTVPVYAESKDLRVRVSMRWNCYAGPCSDFYYGEVEDYTLRVDNPLKSSIVANNDVTDYSEIINDVEMEGVGLELKSIYPDPVLSSDGLVTIDLRSARKTDLTVTVVDLSGNVVKKEVFAVQRGDNSPQLNVRGLAKGTYVLQINSIDKEQSAKLIVQ